MKALLIKDMMVIVKQYKILLLLVVFLGFFDDRSMSMIAIIFGSTMPMSSIAFDERSFFNKLVKLYPYSNWDITINKYVLGYVSLIMTSGIVSLIQLVQKGSIDWIFISFSFLMGCLVIACNLPFLFKLGSEKGRWAFIISMGFIGAIGPLFSQVGIVFDYYLTQPLAHLLMVFMFFVIIINMFSIMISLQINKLK